MPLGQVQASDAGLLGSLSKRMTPSDGPPFAFNSDLSGAVVCHVLSGMRSALQRVDHRHRYEYIYIYICPNIVVLGILTRAGPHSARCMG